ncbi:MerR family transcriptional regulator [Zavarzinia sp. CC-PAN008]|uniref:MerR family transcriptional regulator n=1 Tax=Zavarzinia sp. CC-PAN008 TaxID=3243332 RepID=UPI003F7453AD
MAQSPLAALDEELDLIPDEVAHGDDVQSRPAKSPEAFRTISEVATELDVPQHVLRFWESRFTQVRPLKRGGGRRYYRREDVDLLRGIRHLLYSEGYTIKGVQKLLREAGPKAVAETAKGGRLPTRDAAAAEAVAVEAEGAADEPKAARPTPTPEVLARLRRLRDELVAGRNTLGRFLEH